MEDFYSLVSILKATVQAVVGFGLFFMSVFHFGCIGNYAYPKWFFFNWEIFQGANEIAQDKMEEMLKAEKSKDVETKVDYLDLVSRLVLFFGLAFLFSLMLPAALFMSSGLMWLAICYDSAYEEVFPDESID